MHGVFTEAAVASIVARARTCASLPVASTDDLRRILQIVRTLHPTGAGKWLERATGSSPRTVDYWLAGEYLPRGNAALAIAAALRDELRRMQDDVQQYELDLR